MGKIRLAINGFGRIGRVTSRILQDREDIELVAVNDLTNRETLAHLFKYDSVHGKFSGEAKVVEQGFSINNKTVNVYSERDPANLPWKELGIDVVIEATGIFRDKDSASKHLQAGAKKVIISAPAKGDIPTVVLGVNEHILESAPNIVSNASCTTNCVAPVVKVIEELCGIESGYLTTIHAYTSDQNLQDAPHPDLRRARAAALNMVPTSTGAAVAVTKIFPHLDGKIAGGAVRVPVADGSLTELVCISKRPTSVEELNQAFKASSQGALKGILEYTEDPLVSIDIVGNSHSSIYDSQLTTVVNNLVKVVAWYDNEYGYSSRLVDLISKIVK